MLLFSAARRGGCGKGDEWLRRLRPRDLPPIRARTRRGRRGRGVELRRALRASGGGGGGGGSRRFGARGCGGDHSGLRVAGSWSARVGERRARFGPRA